MDYVALPALYLHIQMFEGPWVVASLTPERRRYSRRLF